MKVKGLGAALAFVVGLAACSDSTGPTSRAGPGAGVSLSLMAPGARAPLASLVVSATSGKIVVNHDEWTLSDEGLARAPDAAQFALNVAGWFAGGTTGNFLVFSTNMGLTQSELASTITGAGHSWTVSTDVDFALPSLLDYDGIFLAGDPADNAVLIDYVNAGGNVYLGGGTGIGGSAAEAARWNSFLNAFDLNFETPYNNVRGVLPISSSHPIFAGVEAVYQRTGNSVSELNPSDPHTDVLEFAGGHGLYAVYAQPDQLVLQDGQNTLMIQAAELVLREIEFERAGELTGCDADEGEVEGSDADGCEEFETDPRVVSLPLDGTVGLELTADVPYGTYDEIEFDVHKVSGDDPADLAFLDEHPDFEGISIRVTGTWNDVEFTYTNDLNEEQEIGFATPMEVSEGGGPVNVTLSIDIATWFVDAAGGLVDPNSGLKGGANEQWVEDNIKASIEGFEDDDRDGVPHDQDNE